MQSGFGRFLGPGRTWWPSEVRGKGAGGIVFGVNSRCQAGLGQLDPKRDQCRAPGRPGTVHSGFGRYSGPGGTWWTSEVRGKGSSGIVFGLNAICQAGLGQLDQNRNKVLRKGAVERSSAGLVDFKGRDRLSGPQRFEGRGPAVPCWVLTQCVRQDWDIWAQNGTIVLTSGPK